MFDKLWKALVDFEQGFNELFPGKSCSVHVVGELTIVASGGNVEIRGPLKELRINGRLVRLKEKNETP